jgi:hypothetical protein
MNLSMKRTQIQLDERTYEALRRRAYDQKKSMAFVARSLLEGALGLSPSQKPSIKDFPFVGCGSSDQANLSPVSERHDEALAAIAGAPKDSR